MTALDPGQSEQLVVALRRAAQKLVERRSIRDLAADALGDRLGGGRDRARGDGGRHLGVGGRHRRLPQPDQPRHLRAGPAAGRAARGAVHHRPRVPGRGRRGDRGGPRGLDAQRWPRFAPAAVAAGYRSMLSIQLASERADARRAQPLRRRAGRVRLRGALLRGCSASRRRCSCTAASRPPTSAGPSTAATSSARPRASSWNASGSTRPRRSRCSSSRPRAPTSSSSTSPAGSLSEVERGGTRAATPTVRGSRAGRSTPRRRRGHAPTEPRRRPPHPLSSTTGPCGRPELGAQERRSVGDGDAARESETREPAAQRGGVRRREDQALEPDAGVGHPVGGVGAVPRDEARYESAATAGERTVGRHRERPRQRVAGEPQAFAVVVGAGREDGGAGDPVQQPRTVGEARPHGGVVQPEPAGAARRGGVGVDGDELEVGAPAQARAGRCGSRSSACRPPAPSRTPSCSSRAGTPWARSVVATTRWSTAGVGGTAPGEATGTAVLGVP